MSTPYALSSDLVSAYPAKSLAIAQFIDGYKTSLAMVQNTQTGTSYTLALADFTKLVTLNNAAAVAVTLPLEATVAWETGTQLRLVNLGAGTVTVAGAVGVTINGTPLTLAQYKGANLIKTGTNTWVFVPFASSIGAAVYSDANTGTYTGFAYKTFTASGTLTVTTAGFADIVVCAGGAGGGDYGGGGAGGVLQVTDAYLPAGTLTVTVGAGGGRSNTGIASRIESYIVPGGGSGSYNSAANPVSAFNGASGGGGRGTLTGGSGVAGIGNNGGNGGSDPTSGGGGGSGAVGVNGSGATPGAGGAGTTVTIAGTTPSGAYIAGTYALGGGGGGNSGVTGAAGGSGGGGAGSSGTGTNGTANKGGGGGGGASGGGSGGSGIVIVRVAI